MVSISSYSKQELIIHKLRHNIHSAAAEFAISPEIVGGIILDELQRRGLQDDLEEIIARIFPRLVYWANWSIGVAQFKPKTAELVYSELLEDYPRPAALVRSLLDDAVSCRLVAAYCRYIINLWKPVYPQAENTNIDQNGARLLGTLYSLEATGTWGVNDNPIFNNRGEAIVSSMPKIRQLIQD